MTGCWVGIQAMRMRGKIEEKNSLYPGYVIELWATDTHYKHQSGMEKHFTHDFSPPSPPNNPPQLKEEVQEIGLCSKKPRGGWKDNGEAGASMTEQVGWQHT